MKLRPPDRFNSFYESFSDLIFGTMAIFILMMMVFLVLVNKGDIEEREVMEKQVEQLVQAAERSRQQLQSVVSELTQLQKAVKTQGLRLVVAVDRTGSMAAGLTDLTETLSVFSNVITKYVPEYEVSVVAYHADPAQFLVLPRQKVLSKDQDAGQSQAAVTSFLAAIQPSAGAAPVARAIDRGLDLQNIDDFSGVQVLMLIGDVGPFEKEMGMAPEVDQLAVDQLLASMARWIGRSDKRKVVSVYADKGCRAASGCVFPEESRLFFRRACELSNDRSDCVNLASEQMLIHLLRAVLVRT